MAASLSEYKKKKVEIDRKLLEEQIKRDEVHRCRWWHQKSGFICCQESNMTATTPSEESGRFMMAHIDF